MSHDYTIRILKLDMGDKLINSLKEGESRCRYSLHGFPLAIMIWAFEAISNLGKKFAKKYYDGIPRMLGWELPKRLTSSEIVNILESKELEVKSTLIPTKAKLEEVSQPPPVCHDHNIADVVRMKMEKLEKMLIGVISKRLNRMEYKIDSLVELAAVSRFHSTTSTCDSPIHNTTNVPVAPPEVKRNEEVGPNDVMDELEKERILEDEDGEELVGGKKAAEDENTKRRKLLDIDIYDPYREVDPSKVDVLNKWMEVASTSDLVPLHHCDVEAKCLLDLLNKDGWLTGEIVNEALYHIRDRALKFPNLFQQDCCILDCYFYQVVQSAYEEWQIHAQSPRNEEFKFSKSLLKYVNGSIPELSKSWKDCRYLYAPCCAIGSHWFAMKIDLEDRTIFIFDSLKSHVRKAELEAFMKPLQVVIPMLMKLHVKCDDSYSTEKFKFVKMKEVPQQHNGYSLFCKCLIV
ncbi:Ulp1 protease family protein [Abeliophyllum distichum]|uniref:Ulp1 protease family protein n=1 Tax=Abeliophyllum distichum TaxID=126358 RepID=A0ABD1V6T0_9LAMI